MLPPVAALDWAFIVGVVLSFVAILFTFDAISGEREGGTLALAMSNPVPRGTFLLSKFFGAFIAIAVPMLMGMVLSLLIVTLSGVVSLSGDEWAQIGLMGALSLIYVALFIGVGLAVSSRMAHSTTSLILLLTVWTVVVALIPNTLGSVVKPLRKVPPQREFSQQQRATAEVLEFRGEPLEELFKYGSPSQPNPQREAVEHWATPMTQWIDDNTRLNDARLDTQFAQVQLARQIRRISPAVIYTYAMESLAGTGFERHRQFVQSARRYRGQFVTFIQEADRADPDSFHIYYLKEGLSSKPVSFEAVPRFVEPSGVGVAMRAALVDFGLLVVMAVVGFMASYAAFLRCSVR
jgi:ABC-type transport system involved in multi-copper enzyme maturation permease subunit